MNEHPLRFFQKNSIVPREQQKRVVDAIHENWDKYDYFALSLPTGVGKTFIAASIADSINRAYILTSTLQLQTQYERSWTELVNLKGRGNYTCQLNTNFTVDAAPCSAQPDLIKLCIRDRLCSYYNQKDLAMKSQSMITNPVYMLYSTHCGFAKEGDENPWVPRTALIIDEAHNLENHLVQFAESEVDPAQLQKEFGIHGAKYAFNGDPEHDYLLIVELQNELMEKAEELQEKINKEFPAKKFFDDAEIKSWARGMTEKVAERVRKLNSKYYALDKAIQPLKIFFNTHSTPEELSRRWLISKYNDKNVLKLAPIYGDFLFTEYFGKLADKFIFLSATLGTKSAFCRELGIDEKDCFFIETDSPFPPEKSPVIVMPSIKLSKDHYSENVKKVGGLIDEILNMHENDRGIIHCIKGTSIIKMSNGLMKRLDEVQVGDEVLSWNESDQRFEPKQVLAFYDNGDRECIELQFDTGRTLICTPDHKLLTKNRGWVEAQDLTDKDDILDDSMKLVSKRPAGKHRVFDITVDDNHNFIANGVVVHNCVTYDLQTQIFNRVSPKNRKRLLCRDMDTLNGKPSPGMYPKKYKNGELLELHENEGGEYGSVLLSPSMMEGVDLVDDLSRFQVIIKLPWGNLGDARIKHKSQADAGWYKNKMWLNILQASGRSTRHEEDSSITYILDSNFKFFYDEWERNLPDWFKKRLVF